MGKWTAKAGTTCYLQEHHHGSAVVMGLVIALALTLALLGNLLINYNYKMHIFIWSFISTASMKNRITDLDVFIEMQRLPFGILGL